MQLHSFFSISFISVLKRVETCTYYSVTTKPNISTPKRIETIYSIHLYLLRAQTSRSEENTSNWLVYEIGQKQRKIGRVHEICGQSTACSWRSSTSWGSKVRNTHTNFLSCIISWMTTFCYFTIDNYLGKCTSLKNSNNASKRKNDVFKKK